MRATITTGANTVTGLVPGRDYTIQITGHVSTTVQLKVPRPGGEQVIPGSSSSADWIEVITMPTDTLIIDYLTGTGDLEFSATLIPYR